MGEVVRLLFGTGRWWGLVSFADRSDLGLHVFATVSYRFLDYTWYAFLYIRGTAVSGDGLNPTR